MRKIIKYDKAITLISLVVTIIVLLIIAGISINMVVGENSLVNISKTSSEDTERKVLVETISMELLDKQLETPGRQLTQDEIKLILEKYGDINYKDSNIYSLTPFNKNYEILIDELYEFIETIKILKFENIVMTEDDSKNIELSYTGIAIEKEFISSNTDIVTVDSNTGELVALKTGEATITVKLVNKNGEVTTGTCSITVVDKVLITDYNNITIVAGNSDTPTLNYTGAIKSKEFVSSNTAIATVDAQTGIVKGVSAGSTTITVKLINQNDVEVTKNCTVTVQTAIAQVGTTYYSSIANAVAAISSSGTVTMCASTTESPTIPSGKTITLSLNSKTITGTIINNGTLTIGGGSVISSSGTNVCTLINYGTLTINSGTYSKSGGTGHTVYNVSGTLTFAGGTISLPIANGGTALYCATDGTVKMTGGTISSNAYGLVINGGISNVAGGTITASSTCTALLVRNTGTASVSSATIKQTGSGYAVANERDSYSCFLKNTTISGNVTGKVELINTSSTYYKYYVWGVTSSAAVVRFPTWTATNGQDDIIWGVGTKGTVNNTTCYYYTVTKSDHNNESGTYNTHVYWYDSAETPTFLVGRSITM